MRFDPYQVLGVDRNAFVDKIKQAFRSLSKLHHPDKGGDPEEFKRIARAWEVLSDPEKRRAWDERGEEGEVDRAGKLRAMMSAEFVGAAASVPDGVDLVELVQQRFQGLREAALNKVSLHHAAAKRFKRAARKVRAKDGENFLAEALEAQASICLFDAKSEEAKAKVCSECLNLLDGFEWDGETSPILRKTVGFSESYWGDSWK